LLKREKKYDLNLNKKSIGKKGLKLLILLPHNARTNNILLRTFESIKFALIVLFILSY